MTTPNIFDTRVQAWVNPVNCVGIMGAGLALKFRRMFPGMYADYQVECARSDMRLGRVWVYDRQYEKYHMGRYSAPLNAPRFIVCFPTKRHWRERSHLSSIQTGMNDLVDSIQTYGITSIAIPALGCGLGELDWNDVEPIIYNAIEPVSSGNPLSQFYIFPPLEQQHDIS